LAEEGDKSRVPMAGGQGEPQPEEHYMVSPGSPSAILAAVMFC
jgi:hypothetical protein